MAEGTSTGFVPFLVGLTLGASIMYVCAVPSGVTRQIKTMSSGAGWYILALNRDRNGRTRLRYVVGPFESKSSADSKTETVLRKGYRTKVRYYTS